MEVELIDQISYYVGEKQTQKNLITEVYY